MKTDCVLLADSQPLFNSPVLKALLEQCIRKWQIDTGIYIGAANHDNPVFFDMAQVAFQRLQLIRHYHLQVSDQAALQITDSPCLIILSGGDPDLGWQFLNQPVIRPWLEMQRELGSIFIGISAGALHLSSGLNNAGEKTDYLAWVNTATAVHEQAEHWPTVSLLQSAGARNILAIPSGDGVIAGSQQLASLKGKAFILSDTDKLNQGETLPVHQ